MEEQQMKVVFLPYQAVLDQHQMDCLMKEFNMAISGVPQKTNLN